MYLPWLFQEDTQHQLNCAKECQCQIMEVRVFSENQSVLQDCLQAFSIIDKFSFNV